MQTKTYMGQTYQQDPVTGEWVRVQSSPAATAAPVVVRDAPPPPPPAPPARTPAGAATEGAPKGFAWRDPNNPSAGVYEIAGLPDEAREGARPEQEPLTAKARVDAEQAAIDARALHELAQQLRVQFNQGPGATSGIYALADFLPTKESNRTFNDLSQQARGLVKRALGFTGGEGNTAAESSALYDPFLPRAGDLDGQIVQKIAALEALARRSATLSSNLLGRPLPEFAGGTRDDDDPTGNALDMIRTDGGGGGQNLQANPLADVGTRQFRTIENPALARAHDQLVQNLLAQGSGRLDPQAYAQGFAQLVQEFGVQDNDAAGREGWARAVNSYLDAGGRTIPTTLTTRELMTAGETAANNLVNNPVTATAIGAANTLGFGIPEAFAPGQMAALRDAQGGFVTLGEIGGAIPATSAVSAIGRNTIGRAFPRLLGQQGVSASQGLSNFARGITRGRQQTLGQVGRNAAADAAYGAAYGGITEGDPLTGATLSTFGSLAGQGGGRTLGALIGGLNRTAAAQALRDRGVPISVARQIGLGRVEDLVSSLPLANEAARGRQLDSFVGFNRAAFDEAAQPTTRLTNPFTAPEMGLGRQGLDNLGQVEDQAYSAALDNVAVPIETQFFRDLRPVNTAIRNLPDDYRAAAETIMSRRVEPAINNLLMTGREYQQAIRGIRQARANAGSNPSLAGFDQEYRDALTGIEDMMTSAIDRGARPGVVNDLGVANEIYSNRQILENASLDRAKVGTRSGEVEVFTPSQLLESTRAAERRYGTGERMRELGQMGQQVLPSTVPNSGTADRLLAAGVLTGAAGVGGGINYDPTVGAQSATEGAGTYAGNVLGAGALLGLLGTRRGQQVLEQILLTRPQAMQNAGSAIRRRGGLFGSAGSTMALQAQ